MCFIGGKSWYKVSRDDGGVLLVFILAEMGEDDILA